jgi:hypothetical protein
MVDTVGVPGRGAAGELETKAAQGYAEEFSGAGAVAINGLEGLRYDESLSAARVQGVQDVAGELDRDQRAGVFVGHLERRSRTAGFGDSS